MSYQKHNWIHYGNSGDIVEITLKDSSGKRFDFFRCDNEKEYRRILKLIEKKMGFRGLDKEDSIDIKKETEQERNWLDKEINWQNTLRSNL